ncbi:MAG: tandem-95 repeat protein, partial [Pseudomonadales bacterium]|nr:tandem-95 repeat protein [Pseudomonadales bacterium]
GTYTVIPNPDFSGRITINYQVKDGNGGVVAASNSFDVDAVNDAPVPLAPLDNQIINEGQAFSYQLPSTAFMDVDSSNLTYTAVLADGSPLPAWLSFNDKTQTFSGTPSFSDSDVLQIKVIASDGSLNASQIFVIDVKNVNQAPIAIVDAPLLATDEDKALTIDVLARVTDPDMDVLTIESASAISGGVVFNVDKTITYTPFDNFNGFDQITYTVKDAQGATFTRTEQITVKAV